MSENLLHFVIIKYSFVIFKLLSYLNPKMVYHFLSFTLTCMVLGSDQISTSVKKGFKMSSSVNKCKKLSKNVNSGNKCKNK